MSTPDNNEIILEKTTETPVLNQNINHTTQDVQQDVLDIITFFQEYSFIKIQDDGIYIDNTLLLWTQIQDFFDKLFLSWLYIEGLNHNTFTKLLLKDKTFWQFFLWKSIKKISEERKKMYPNPDIDRYKDPANSIAMFNFSKVYSHNIWEKWEEIDEQTMLDIDEFVSIMWTYGIKFWLKIEEIKKTIQEVFDSKNPTIAKKIVIAESLKPKNWIDAKLIALTNLKINHWINALSDSHKADLTSAKRSIPKIEKWQKLFSYKPPRVWTDGMDIFWVTLDAKWWKNIIVRNSLPWLEVKKENWSIIVVAHKSGFLSEIDGFEEVWWWVMFIEASKLWDQIITIDDNITLPYIYPSIDSAPGHVIVTWSKIKSFWENSFVYGIPRWFRLENAVSLDLSWEVEWWIFCEKDIIIKWNVTWTEKQDPIKPLQNWEIISENWNITISWNVNLWNINNWTIKALNWNVELKSQLYNSLVFAKEIKSLVWAQNSVFIWEDIILEWNYSGCTFVFTWNLTAKQLWEMSQKKWNNRILIIPPKDIEKQKELKKIEIIELENKIKTLKVNEILYKRYKEKKDLEKEELVFLNSFFQSNKDYVTQFAKAISSGKDYDLSKAKQILVLMETKLKELNEQLLNLENMDLSLIKLPKIHIDLALWNTEIFHHLENIEQSILSKKETISLLLSIVKKLDPSTKITDFSWKDINRAFSL